MKKMLALVLTLALVLLCVPASFAEAADEGYVETTVMIDAEGDHQIPATICMPTSEGTHPAVVMLHGTGSSRDEAGNGYATAAPILAKEYGIATIRIDFMGNGESTEDYTRYTFASATMDALVAAEYMKAQDGIDGEHIGVMGWSQGGTDALLAAGKYSDTFSSVVTWAGAPDLSDMLTDELYAEAEKNGYFVMTFDWRDALNVSLDWCNDVRNTDVLAEFAAYEGPVLAIAGTEDTTVDPEWSNKIVAANSNSESATYFIEGMDHTFNVFAEEDFHSLKDAVKATGEFFQKTLAAN